MLHVQVGQGRGERNILETGMQLCLYVSLFSMLYLEPSSNVSLSYRKVHKYGKSTTSESWDIVVDEETYYE